MHRFGLRFRRSPLTLLAASSLCASLAAPVLAADSKIEAEAKKLEQDAMDVDFLALDLASAQKKLESAIKKCGKDKCNTALLAGIHRDLGVVLINAGDGAAGERSFETAIATDASVVMPKDFLDNVEVRKTWEIAKKKGSAPPPPKDEPKPEPPKDEPKPADGEGGLGIKAKVAPVGVELPIVVDVPASLGAFGVKVSYRTDAMDRFKVVEAKQLGDAWVAILPCAATGAAGKVKVFAKAFDEKDVELDHAGSAKKPLEIELKAKLAEGEEAPLLPGDKEPKTCAAAEPVNGEKKSEGSGCATDDECVEGLLCLEGESGKLRCAAGEHKPTTPPTKHKRLWVGVEGDLGFFFLSADSNLCQQSTWACSVDGPSGRQDVGVNANGAQPVISGGGGTTPGGSALGPIHALVTFDYLVTQRIALGAKLGWGFGGNPTSSQPFVPFYGEARFHYFFLDGSFRPYVAVAAGYANLDAAVPNVTVATGNASAPTALTGVTAYKLLGTAFAAIGAGAWIEVAPMVAINVGVKAEIPFPTFAFGIAPELGLKLGF